jgi:SNF2-related domain/Helicase conserved C-terminal domain/SWIM zinc finger
MSLSSKLAFEFNRSVQVRGQELHASGAVRPTDIEANHFHGSVQGGRQYEVCLQYTHSGYLTVSCECPYFQDSGACKHLWAAVLEADRRGALSATRDYRYLKLEELDFPTSPDEPFQLTAARPKPQPRAWETDLNEIQRSLDAVEPPAAGWQHDFELLYVFDLAYSRSSGAAVVEVLTRNRKKNGEWSAPKEFRLSTKQIPELPDPVDADLITTILGGYEGFSYSYSSTVPFQVRKTLPHGLALKLLPQFSATGRFFLSDNSEGPGLHPLEWDAGDPWQLWLDVRQDDRDQWKISGSLRRGEERMELDEPRLILESGLLIAAGRVARFEHGGAYPWVVQLRSAKHIAFPDREREQVLARLLDSPILPPLNVDEPLRFEHRQATPQIGLRITEKREWNGSFFEGKLLFNYGPGWIEDGAGRRGMWSPEERVYISRDTQSEAAARARLSVLGLRQENDAWRLNAKQMPRIVRELIQGGWHVEAEGKAFRRPGATRVEVSSGIDWFDLMAEVDYGDGVTASLPQLLAALRRGDTMVRLGDGSFGLLPEDWLQRFAPLAGLGSPGDERLRFQRNQAGLLDALLAAQPEVRVDEVFERVRERMRSFQGIQAAEQPAGFVGQLRGYQCEGLGWMEFLREFGFGGCLADDMGVGKTAQVLALLESRRGAEPRPSLVVAPKSLMFNWREEAARFTPELRVLEHTGIGRDTTRFEGHHLVLTTYGTLVRDVALLSEIQFDYVVLDEAQAIKNASTASAKAVRLLRGNHRLALSGTPIENHLGELWSLFEFLNPGMLGEAKVLKMAGGLARNPSEESRQLLAHALRPFILRRTKQQVARELPAKTEQTIICELEPEQRKQYDELRQHYRDTLLHRIEKQGMGKSKMHVLEALLRLRQASCHPGLIDPKLAGEPSAKIDTLMAQLEEIREEGHKALVFSQFTSLLAIVRDHLDSAGVRYEYLDGATRDRQARVDNFQNDESCGLFLISLKAGGLGLNLTAAEYVFLLDPWWNPAVEAQAVDRAHRIGQTRPVFAYRLIAKDTVEEKVLELQKTKRDLADAIIGEDNSLIRGLKREDLELLLS